MPIGAQAFCFAASRRFSFSLPFSLVPLVRAVGSQCFLLGLILYAVVCPARAAPPATGLEIINLAVVEFTTEANGAPGGTNLVRMQSEPVRVIIQGDIPPAGQLDLSPGRSLTATVGSTVSLPHRLDYSGTGPAMVTLQAANGPDNDYDLTNLRLFRDPNRNGVVDTGEIEIANGGSLTVNPGTPLDLVIVGELPSSPLLGGQAATIQLTATVPASGLAAMSENRVSLLAELGSLFTQITASRQSVEIGDMVELTIRIRNATGIDLADVVAVNNLSAGFAYQQGTARREGVTIANPEGGAGPQLVFPVGALPNDGVVTLTLVVRAGPGTTKGNGVFTAWSTCTQPRVLQSNRATVKLEVKQGGVFTDMGVVLGKVFIDANQNRIQDLLELGVPGIRLYMEDGTYVITDSEGKYSFYGVSPKTHVLKLDETTLPTGAVLLAPSTRHAGSGGTRFVDINRGEIHKANFTIGYPVPEVIEEVKARRLRAEGRASEIDAMIKGRLTPDGALVPRNDPRSLPASGVISDPVNAGPSLVTGLVPGAAGRTPRVTASTNTASSATNGMPLNPVFGPQLPLEPALETVATNTLGFVDFKDGDILPMAQSTIRVQGVQGSKLVLRVNGQEVSASRLGKRATLAEKRLEVWEYVGVELQPGNNEVEVVQIDAFGNERGREGVNLIAPDKPGSIRIFLPKEGAVADGKTPAKVVVEVTDGAGVRVTARLPLTLSASQGEWQVEDFDTRTPATQVFIEGGHAEFYLTPPLEPGESHIQVSSGAMGAEAVLHFLPELRPLLAVGVLEGTVNFSDLNGNDAFPPRSQDGFAEELQAFALNDGSGSDRYGGRAALFVKGKVLGKYLLTVGFDSDKDTKERLFRDIQPDEFYPVYGDSSVKGFDAQSTGRLYVRVDRKRCYVLYGDFVTTSQAEASSLGNYSRSLTGGRVHLENEHVRLNVWASEDSTRQVIDEMRGNGTSGPYQFSAKDGIINSEKVEIITRDRNQRSIVIKSETLTRFTDYEFEPFTGRLLLRRSLPSVDEYLNPVFIRVTYEVEQGGDKFWVYGADGQVKLNEHIEVGGSVVRDENPLAEYHLYSANSTIKLAKKTYVLGEVAHSSTALADGDAGRIELRHQDEKTDARFYFGEAGNTFSNNAAGIMSGRREAGAQISHRLAPNTRLLGQAIYSESTANDGHREGGTLSVEQTLPGKVRVEVGGRHSTETAAPAGPTTATPAGVTPNEVNSARAKVTVPVPFVKQASVYGEVENDVIETDKRLLAVGGEMQVGPKTRLYARHEFINALGGPFELNNFQEQNTTVVGLDTEYMKEGSVFSEYRGRDAFSGREAEAAVGLRNGWSLAEGLRLNTTFERVNPIVGDIQNEATAGAAAVEYTRNPDWKGTARLELRVSSASDSVLNTLGLARKLSTDWTFLGKTIYYGVQNNGPTGGSKTQARFQAGLAYRQTRTDRWNALMKYQYKFEDDGTQPRGDLERQVHIFSLHANYQPTRDWILSGHYASKFAWDSADGFSDFYDAHLVALRATYRSDQALGRWPEWQHAVWGRLSQRAIRTRPGSGLDVQEQHAHCRGLQCLWIPRRRFKWPELHQSRILYQLPVQV